MRRILLCLALLIICIYAGATVLIYGDTRNHPEVHRELIARVQELRVNAVFHTGDLNQKGKSQSEYDSFKEIISPLPAPFYAIRGNHEKDLALFIKNFPSVDGLSFYSVICDSLKFIILDSNLPLLPGSAQYRWLVNELESSKLPLILMLHHPVFSSGYHGDELGLQYYLPQLFKKYPVAAVISGHEHSFEHLIWEGLDFFVSGGGGAPLREQGSPDPRSVFFNMIHHYNLLIRQPQALLWQCFDLKGDLLYETTISLP